MPDEPKNRGRDPPRAADPSPTPVCFNQGFRSRNSVTPGYAVCFTGQTGPSSLPTHRHDKPCTCRSRRVSLRSRRTHPRTCNFLFQTLSFYTPTYRINLLPNEKPGGTAAGDFLISSSPTHFCSLSVSPACGSSLSSGRTGLRFHCFKNHPPYTRIHLVLRHNPMLIIPHPARQLQLSEYPDPGIRSGSTHAIRRLPFVHALCGDPHHKKNHRAQTDPGQYEPFRTVSPGFSADDAEYADPGSNPCLDYIPTTGTRQGNTSSRIPKYMMHPIPFAPATALSSALDNLSKIPH